MRIFYIELDKIKTGVVRVDDVDIELTQEDAHDLNELSGVTTLTTNGEEVIVRPDW